MWPSTIGTKRWAASKQILKIVELMQCTKDQRNSTHSTGDSWYAKDGADCNLAGEIWVTMTLAAKFQYLFAFCKKASNTSWDISFLNLRNPSDSKVMDGGLVPRLAETWWWSSGKRHTCLEP